MNMFNYILNSNIKKDTKKKENVTSQEKDTNLKQIGMQYSLKDF